jgi:signal transduction histidine kinase
MRLGRHDRRRGKEGRGRFGMEGPPGEEVQLDLELRLFRRGRLRNGDLEHVAPPAHRAAHTLEERDQIGYELGVFESDTHRRETEHGALGRLGLPSLSAVVASDADRKSEVCPSPGLIGPRGRLRPMAEERSRLARELHDGPAQELAFILMQGRQMLAGAPEPGALQAIVKAAQAGLADCRRIASALAAPHKETDDARGPATGSRRGR